MTGTAFISRLSANSVPITFVLGISGLVILLGRWMWTAVPNFVLAFSRNTSLAHLDAEYPAVSAEAASEAAQRHSFDLLITDVALPGKSGPEFANEFRVLAPGRLLIRALCMLFDRYLPGHDNQRFSRVI